MLAEERLEEFADRVQTRILEGKPAGVKGSRAGMQQDKYNDILQNHAETFQAFLNYSGGRRHMFLSGLRTVQQFERLLLLQVWLTTLMCSSLLSKAMKGMSNITQRYLQAMRS